MNKESNDQEKQKLEEKQSNPKKEDNICKSFLKTLYDWIDRVDGGDPG